MNLAQRFKIPLALAFALACLNATAVCFPTPRYVGDTASDSQCTDNDIQSAINNTSCPNTRIYITGTSYASQHLTISGKSLSLIGEGNANCGVINQQPGNAAQATAPLTTLSGDNSGDSVIHIDGTSNVTLQNLTITGGHVSNSGGGIYFGGTGSLTLDTTTVNLNHAGYGGGIDVSPSGGAATLTLGANTLILGNTADTSGGGIRIEGDTRLFALQPQTLIGYNQATSGYGGGIEILGPARADIGSPGYNGLGVVSWNTATDGGGIAAVNDGAVARIFAYPYVDSNRLEHPHPTVIASNTATADGGGVYLQDATDVCLFLPDFDDNVAEDGAAIYQNESFPGGIYINSGFPSRLGTECGPESVGDLGGNAGPLCDFGVPCNVFENNQTQHPDGSPSLGAVIYHHGGELKGSRIRMQHNAAGYALQGDVSQTLVSRCLITDNLIYNAVIRSDFWGGAYTSFDQCTFSHNVLSDYDYVFEFLQMNDVSLSGDIIDQQGHASVNFTPYANGENIGVHYTMSNDIDTLPHPVFDSTVVRIDDPGFVDPAIGDYHLRNDSPALDFEPVVDDLSLDCVGGWVDLPDVPNRFGPSDLGAYELSITDRIFGSGFGDIMKPVFCQD